MSRYEYTLWTHNTLLTARQYQDHINAKVCGKQKKQKNKEMRRTTTATGGLTATGGPTATKIEKAPAVVNMGSDKEHRQTDRQTDRQREREREK